MPVTGFETVAKNIIKYQNGFLNSVNRVMKEVKVILDDEVTANMSLKDHSLKDLAKLGHPYGINNTNVPHSPIWLVHTQSGKMLRAKSSDTIDASINGGILKASAFVKIDGADVPYALAVINGTSKMIPRPFLAYSRDKVQEAAYEHIRNTLRNLKVNL